MNRRVNGKEGSHVKNCRAREPFHSFSFAHLLEKKVHHSESTNFHSCFFVVNTAEGSSWSFIRLRPYIPTPVLNPLTSDAGYN
jgi:hypothetical protein